MGANVIAEHFLVWAALLSVVAFLAFQSPGRGHR
ncbi:hypothetical protein SAMN05216337_1001315 [Bradyrhizobium brasilense]|uniref:Uncharacterized protein n=1 Tax=Bradyrhizobium brasilense TaxID=1419277 RepID=A0A1G6J253_9BRAD|nr:hypothetical protein SAMN05216337_1001315 [Bradyrhizobium brasilense]